MLQGKSDLPQADHSLSQAVTVRPPGNKQAVFCGETGQGEDLLGGVGRMENLDPLKSCFHQVGETGQPLCTRVGQDRDAFYTPNRPYGLASGERDRLHISWAPPGQEAVEGLLQAADRPLGEQGAGDMKSSDRSLPGYPHHIRHGKRYPTLLQPADDFLEPLVPSSLQGQKARSKCRIVPAETIPEDMDVLAELMHRQLDARDDVHL